MNRVKSTLIVLGCIFFVIGIYVGVLYTTNWFSPSNLYHTGEIAFNLPPIRCEINKIGTPVKGNEAKILTRSGISVITLKSIVLDNKYLDWFDGPENKVFILELSTQPDTKYTTHYIFLARCNGKLYERRASRLWIDVVEQHHWSRFVLSKIYFFGSKAVRTKLDFGKIDITAPDRIMVYNTYPASVWCNEIDKKNWQSFGETLRITSPERELVEIIVGKDSNAQVNVYSENIDNFPYLKFSFFPGLKLEENHRLYLGLQDRTTIANILLCRGELYFSGWENNK